MAGFALVVAQSCAHFVVTLGATIGFNQSDSTFDLHRSNGVPDIVSTVVIVAGAVGAIVLAGYDRSGRLPAAGLAVALLVIAIDDTLHTGDRGTGTYGLVVIATLFAGGALATWVALRTAGTARACLLVGLGLLVVDAKAPFLYDQLMNTVQLAPRRGDFLYELGVVLDEGMELMGWVLVTVGLWDAALAARPATSRSRRHLALDLEFGEALVESRTPRPLHADGPQGHAAKVDPGV